MTHSSELLRSAKSRGWRVESAVRGVAGTIVLASLLLSVSFDERWLWLTAFVGANLLQSSLTGWCLMSNVLALLEIGVNDRA
jgi:hypothetical protein